jgi:hypothetical protein
MKETRRRSITVTPPLNVISTDQLGNRVVVRDGFVNILRSPGSIPSLAGRYDNPI